MADSTLTPFADSDALTAFWRPLNTAESARAGILLALASNRLRQVATDVNIDLDAKVAASEVTASVAQWVVMEAVKRAMLVPTDAPPVNQMQTAAGPYSENYIFTNPSGDLWFKNSELKALGLWGVQTMSSISTVPRWDVYGS